MDLYYIKCLMFTKNRNIKIKHKTDGKMNLYFYCIDCSFKIFETFDKAEVSYLLERLI